MQVSLAESVVTQPGGVIIYSRPSLLHAWRQKSIETKRPHDDCLNIKIHVEIFHRLNKTKTHRLSV